MQNFIAVILAETKVEKSDQGTLQEPERPKKIFFEKRYFLFMIL
jgi:hypothetical protein